MITKNHRIFLSKADKTLKKIIEDNKIPKISKSQDFVLDLYKYIIFQQISTKAGNSIFNRFIKYYKNNKDNISGWNDSEWKSIGLSIQKKSYIENIFFEKKDIYALNKSNDIDYIRNQLIKIKGVGNWTIDMFLIFSKGEVNIKKKYQVDSMDQILEIANKWSPYKTIATLYLWESLEDDFPN